jgi:putative hemolysin
MQLASATAELAGRRVYLPIAQSHRNRQVLFLLWKGLALYAIVRQKRFLFGCCSLTSQDESEGQQIPDHLTRNSHMHPTFFVRPKPGFECGTYGPGPLKPEQVKVPRLFDTCYDPGVL